MNRLLTEHHRVQTTRPLVPLLWLLAALLSSAACARTALEPQVYGLGQTTTVDGWQVTVHSFSTVPGDQWRQPSEGAVFCAVELTLKNVSNRIRFIMPERQMQLLDSSGRSLSLDYHAGVMTARLRNWFVPQGAIEPGQEMHGAAAYQIRAGSSGLRWVFRSGLFPWARKVVFLIEQPLPPSAIGNE